MTTADDLFRAAARAGHTVLPHDVAMRSLTRGDVDSALAEGVLVEVEWQGGPAWALTDVAESEELLADGLATLAEENRLAVVAGPDPAGRRVALARALGAGVPSVVLDEAHHVGLDDVLAAVEDLPEDAVLVLSLDSGLPLGAVTGAVALDVAASGICPVLVGDAERDARALGVMRAAVSAGRWTAPAPDDRTCVLVPVASPDECMMRVRQLVSTSIPRAFGAAEIGVVTTDPGGVVGVDALRAALDGVTGVEVMASRDAVDRVWPAAVVVLPGVVTPTLTRAVVYAGLRNGRDHVSVVHGFGPGATALGQLVATTTDRPRRTRLAELLRP